MRFQRRGGRKRIVAPDGSEIVPTTKPQPDGTLVKALARAWRWQRMLDEGVYTSVSEIGDAENISKSYVSRILRLALLAPDIVEAILAGTDGSGADAGEAGAAAAGELGGAAPGVPVCRLGGHTAATLGTAAAGFRAFLHIVEPLAALRALRAHLRANSTGALVELGPKFHEERTRAANLGAGQHEPRVPRLDVLTAHVEAVLRERRQAHAVTSQAVVYAAPHLLVHRVHDLLHCCAAPLAGFGTPGLARQLASASAGPHSVSFDIEMPLDRNRSSD